jgi:protein phosphatase
MDWLPAQPSEVLMTHAPQIHWTSSSRSHVGLIREINEDACLDRPERGLWVVADGMGGHSLGDYASRMVVGSLDGLPASQGLSNTLAAAHERIQAVNRQLRAEAALRHTHIIGSTVVLLVAGDRRCGYLWAGDSRIYLYRNSRLTQLTRDHSQIEELKTRGAITAEGAINHPAQNMITRAVGAMPVLELDQEMTDVQNGDMFVLCSDGLSNGVREPEMCEALNAGDCERAAEALLEMALKAGGRDNISVVVVRADDPSATDRTVLNPAL